VTAAGKLIVFQSGGPTPVVNASLVGAVRAGRERGVPGILGARFGFEGVLASNYVDLTDISASAVERLRRTPGAALGSSRHRPSDAETAQAVELLHERGVEYVVAVGGNDTADSLHRLHDAARASSRTLAVVGIPKTIDNDLVGMDHCPGYGSAARYMALALREADLDTAAMQRTDPIKIVEVMGRNSGWLAAAGALARESIGDAPQVIFLPERPRPLSQMLSEIRVAHAANGWAVIVVCENQRNEAGQPVAGGEPAYVDAHGHPYFESVGAFLARAVQAELGLRARYERPGSLQRTSALAISETDLVEAELVGAEAVHLAVAGESDTIVAIQREPGPDYRVSLGCLPLAEVARAERKLPDAFIADSGIDVTDRFLDYARPLIGGPLPELTRLSL